MDEEQVRELAPREKALVAVAVLLDGHEAAGYLAADRVNGGDLQAAAKKLAGLEPELRMPFVGSSLRSALQEMK